MEEQVLDELQSLMDGSKKQGFLSFLQNYENTTTTPTDISLLPNSDSTTFSTMSLSENTTSEIIDNLPLNDLFTKGSQLSSQSWQEMVILYL